MKKLLGFLIVAAVVGCKCIYPQPPTQYLNADENCQAVLPNYLDYVSVRENCANYTLTQIPPAGTILNAINPWVTVVITVTDISGLKDVDEFNVILNDKIPPEIIWDSIPGDTIAYVYDANALFVAWRNAIRDSMYEDAENMPDSIYSPGLDSWYPAPDLKQIFDSLTMITTVHPKGHGITRWISK